MIAPNARRLDRTESTGGLPYRDNTSKKRFEFDRFSNAPSHESKHFPQAQSTNSKNRFEFDIFPNSPSSEDKPSTDKRKKILLVDDNDIDRTLIKTLLEKSQSEFDIVESGSIELALEAVTNNKYHALLLDYRLPDGIGPEYIEEIRNQADNMYLPVIVLTGSGDEHTAIESFKDGASDYMPKDDMSTASLFRALNNSIHKAELQHHVNDQRRVMIEANSILKMQNREINSFYQTVSHELKTPLTGAREYASLVMDGVVGEINDDQKELLACSIQCCDSLKILVDDLLDAAEFENDSMRISLEECDLKDIVENALRCISLKAQNKSAQIDFSCDDNLPSINVDKTRITQVVSNIVNNAKKFSDECCEINLSIKVDQSNECVELSIADNGPGIPEAMRDKIFEKFYQVKENTESKHSGMGLGLYLCKKIIEVHGGELKVKSTLDIGSTFIFSLPFSNQNSSMEY